MKRAFIVGVALLFTSPVFGELSPMFEHGLVPVDGYHDSAATSGYRFRPNLKDGQRLSGVVTINPLPYAPAATTAARTGPADDFQCLYPGRGATLHRDGD